MDGTILLSVGDVFIFGFPVVVREEVLVGNGINIDMSRGFDRGSNIVRFMSFGVN